MELNKEEKTLLLYLETCAVDHGGAVQNIHMNEEDFTIVEKWNKSGFIKFGRVCSEDIKKFISVVIHITHWVQIPDKTLKIAHSLRKERMKRMWKNRTWQTTEEMRNE